MTNTRLAEACVTYACEDLKIPIVPVIFVDPKIFPNKTITAMFLPDQNIILFNQKWLSTALPEEIALVAFHESRHAYQKYMIMVVKDYDNSVFSDQVRVWKDEMQNYIQPVTYNADNDSNDYMNQNIEIDAIRWSQRLLSSVFQSDFHEV